MTDVLTTYPLDQGVVAGITKRRAGIFTLSQPETCQGLVFASKILSLLDAKSPGISQRKIFVMDSKGHTGKVSFWNLDDSPHAQGVCDGVIWSHEGMVVCFSGGCPVLAFVSKEEGLLGMLHCGWKTIGRRIITNFATQWQLVGGSPKNTSVKFLPAICRGCLTFHQSYWKKEVSPALRWTGQEPHEFAIVQGDLIGLDLFKLSTTILAQCGFREIETDGVCTSCSNEYWDYRRHDSKERGGPKFRNAAFLIRESLPHLA